MDRLESYLKNLGDRFRNLSLKKSLAYYLVIAIVGVMFCNVTTHLLCADWKLLVAKKYGLNPQQTYGSFFENGYIDDAKTQEEKGYNIIWLLQAAESSGILVYSLLAVILTSHIYYKNKLKEPLYLLQQEAACIAREDLSFACVYESKDEMGEICESFDRMRQQLVVNQKNHWDLMEDQRQLNAAFAHDLRTPLTVISGYIEMLMEYYPEGNIPQQKMQETLQMISKQVNRLKEFSDTMKRIHTFEQMQVRKKHQRLRRLYDKIYETVRGLQKLTGLQLVLSDKPEEAQLYCDEQLIIEVFDNLMSNALRYAKSRIDICMDKTEDKVLLYIRDDGRGFSDEELIKAARPYYSAEAKLEHYGLGLSICKMLCEKHGGNLKLSNSIHGGAISAAEFYYL